MPRNEIVCMIDRHSPGIARDEKRIINAYAAVMSALSDLQLADADCRQGPRACCPVPRRPRSRRP